MMNKVITNLGLVSVLLVGLGACTESAPDQSNADVATQWLEAGQTSQEASVANIEANMADDGVMYRDRYVGFGFTFDNTDESGQMIVETVIDGSPASAVLAVGDEFMSVRGVAVTAENRDSGQLSFRGAPGEVVDAVIKRGDEMIDISVARGKIESTLSKS
jgi:C-terminal processing protease CtpA/Prc